MKIFLVGDNRDRLNWGCRATSIALSNLIKTKSNQIIGNITGKETLSGFTPTIKGGILPKQLALISYKFKKKPFFSKIYKFNLKCGCQYDFIDKDIEQTTLFFLKYADKFSHLKKIKSQILNSDIIIVNGEGSFIFSNPPRRDTLYYLFILNLSHKLGKRTALLNAMMSESPTSKKNNNVLEQSLKIFKSCDIITLRDPESFRFLKNNKIDTNIKFIPDALFSWRKYIKAGLSQPISGNEIIPFPESIKYWDKYNFNKNYICVSGSSIAGTLDEEDLIQSYIQLIKELTKCGHNIFLVPTCTGDKFLEKVAKITDTPLLPIGMPIIQGVRILSNAKLFISGRFHPSIMASLGGTPCIFFNSNSHKTRSLQEMLGYSNIEEFNIPISQNDLKKIIELTHKTLGNQELRNTLNAKVENLSNQANKISELITLNPQKTI